jgi:hypothetical protein
MRNYVLAYHSHRVLGNDYRHNDHVALAVDLQVIHDAGGTIVALDRIVDGVVDRHAESGQLESAPQVALTFYDGPIYDAADFEHPDFGIQRGFVNILRDFAHANARQGRSHVHATSFVIASPDARRCMETTYDSRHSYVGSGALTDDWWLPAIETGLLSVANHSFDHLHPGLPRVAHSTQARGDFSKVQSVEDADAQIAAASAYIRHRTGELSAPFFAYPFGQYNAFLVDDYLPAHARRIGLRAAFTTDAEPITGSENVWCLPRYVCGHHWKSPAELRAILVS